MPPTLDLSSTFSTFSTFSHSDMILSSRNSPRISLRRAGSYNNSDRGPTSSTSARFSFNHLIASPPPSPSLPALIPRHGKSLSSHKPRKALRAVIWIFGVVVIIYYGFAMTGVGRRVDAVGWATHSGQQFEMVGDSELPKFPTPVVVTDKRGRAKWTVSIPPDSHFPLEPKQYAEICQRNMEVAKHVADSHRHMHIEHAAHFGYYHVDPNFMDIADAEHYGLLPGAQARTGMSKHQDGSLLGENKDGLIQSDICQKSMTFVMETPDAGFGKTLMHLWSAYGLAKREGRAFFVDDSKWAYGKYTNFFKPPPIPNCRPPPRHEMLPCPHHARHLVVSAATVGSTFGGAFNDYFEDPKKMGVFRQKPVFDMIRQGYEDLFYLRDDDSDYVNKRVGELVAKTQASSPDMENGLVVGIHVRHGDRHPFEFQYKDSYIPLSVYNNEAREQLYTTFNSSGPDGGENLMAEMKSVMIVASDDPEVYESIEFSHTLRAQEQIRLASKPQTSTPKSAPGPRKFVAETVGWEGGFFAGMFWSLGRPSSVPVSAAAVNNPDTNLPATEEALRLRELVGRAYLMDLAVLGEASDKLVCTVSAMACRLLAVMMGWDKAIEKEGWKNVDGSFEWRGLDW